MKPFRKILILGLIMVFSVATVNAAKAKGHDGSKTDNKVKSKDPT